MVSDTGKSQIVKKQGGGGVAWNWSDSQSAVGETDIHFNIYSNPLSDFTTCFDGTGCTGKTHTGFVQPVFAL